MALNLTFRERRGLAGLPRYLGSHVPPGREVAAACDGAVGVSLSEEGRGREAKTAGKSTKRVTTMAAPRKV